MEARRHDLLRLGAGGWQALLRRRPDLAGIAAVQAWAARLHPAMSRRRQADDAPGWLPAAIALPPSEGRARLAFELLAGEIDAVLPPPLLHDALGGALGGAWPGRLPGAWIEPARRLVGVGGRLGIAPRLFGSLMWQCVTGMPYARDGSDLDLLWVLPPGADALARVPALLAALDAIRSEGVRVDGEIVFPDGAANWQELLAARPEDEVLVKTETAITLTTRARLLDPAARR